jgi:TPR repeat protein
MCLIQGKGTDQNLTDGENNLRIAAFQGSINAKSQYGTLLINNSDSRSIDLEEALEFLIESAEDSNPLSLDTLGICYYEGRGVKRDFDKSVEYITRSAQMGYPNSQYNLALLYADGKLIQKNSEFAVHLLIKASNQGHKLAKIKLANIYILGIGCEVNKQKAHELYQSFFDFNLDFSNSSEDKLEIYFDLAMHYYNGTFDFFDYTKSLEYLQHIYEHAENKSILKKKAYNVSPKVLKKFIQNIKTVSKDDYNVMMFFDDNGHPVSNRNEVMSFLVKDVLINGLKMMDPSRFKFTKKMNNPKSIMLTGEKKIGRNESCPCNSGKKYKACCLK